MRIALILCAILGIFCAYWYATSHNDNKVPEARVEVVIEEVVIIYEKPKNTLQVEEVKTSK